MGRHIRGNSVLEAVSAGTLVMMNKRNVTFHELVGHHIETVSDVIAAIKYYESHPDEYDVVIKKQRDIKNCLFRGSF